MKLKSVVIAAAFGAVTVGAWAYANRPASEPAWPSRVQGFAFSPYPQDQDPSRGDFPSLAQIESDLKLLAGKTHRVRTYSTAGSLEAVPQLARKHGIDVTVGAWINANLADNEAELARAMKLAKEQRNVVRVVVGNEVVLRNDVPIVTLINYLDRARARTSQPVRTAEPWHVWLKHPELAEHVDFISVHMLPYWEGIDVDRAVEYTVERYREAGARVSGQADRHRRSGLAEQRAHARIRGGLGFQRSAVPAPLPGAREAGEVRLLPDGGLRPAVEGPAGRRGRRVLGRVRRDRARRSSSSSSPSCASRSGTLLASVSVALAVLLLSLFYLNSRALRSRGRSFLAVVVYATATAAVWVIYDCSQQYFTVTSALVGSVLLFGMLGVIAVLLAEAHEWAEAHWSKLRERALPPPLAAGNAPKVSIHVPAYNEPPEMLIETLDALARLDYPNFEVLVIDNNTRDEAVWRPVKAHCRKLGSRFRFFHVAPLAGFKAGALNFALRETSPEAAVVAVIDSDYVVSPNWLRDLMPHFAERAHGDRAGAAGLSRRERRARSRRCATPSTAASSTSA